jgi:flavin reductase (DIM6/NTAB) family NADH-FMN oxidoreductase RutF
MHESTVEVPLARATRLVNHGPVVLLSTTDGTTPNAAPIAWLMPADFDPPLFLAVISKEQKTCDNLLQTREAVINVPTLAQIDLVRRLGSVSGRQEAKLSGLALAPGREVGAPRLPGCAAWIEVVLEEVVSEPREIYLLRGVCAAAPRDALDEHGAPVVSRYPSLHHVGAKRFAIAERLA